mgnify:CR=1 FL=1
MTVVRFIESIRPSDEAIDAEFDAQRRESVFKEILHATGTVVPITAKRRRWPSMVAAAVAAVAVVGLTAQALTTLGGSVSDPSRLGPMRNYSTSAPLNAVGGSAVALLAGVAMEAAAAPAPTTGVLLHVVRVEEQHSVLGDGSTEVGRTRHDDYTDGDGWLWSRRTGDQDFWLLTPQGQASIMSLPSDPDALESALRAGTGNNSGDERVFKAIDEILRTETAPAALRAAAITVLRHIAESPQAPVTTKDGQTATPSVVVTAIALDGTGETGYRAAITDPTSRPGVEYWLVLDATGQIMQSGMNSPDVTFTSTILTREWADSLPLDFTNVLGTDHVVKEIDG